MKYFIIIILILNLLWFGAAFHFFSLKSNHAAKMFLPKEIRTEPYNTIIAQLLKFLGGFNLAFFVLCILAIVKYQSINNNLIIILFFVLFVAHGTQFWFNVPLAIDERKNQQPIWTVLKGRMYFIFKGDFILTILNLLFAVYLLFNYYVH